METKIGIYPASIQQSFGCHTGRRVVYAQTFRSGSAYKDTILLNVDHNFLHQYTKDANLYAERCVKIFNTLKPELIVCENEEFLKQPNSVIRSLDEMNLYWDELEAAANALPNKCANGGITLPELSYLYYQETGDTDFWVHNIFKKDEYLNGDFKDVIDMVKVELAVLKSLPLYAINIHYYIGRVEQTDGLIRMIKWLNVPVLSNEAGIFTAGLLPEVVRVAKETEMPYIILYSGNGNRSSLPISKTDFNNAIQEA